MALTVLLENGPTVLSDAESWTVTDVQDGERLQLLNDKNEVVAEFYTWIGVMKRPSNPSAEMRQFQDALDAHATG